MNNNHHRLDIDGLRAIAVLSVFIYHLNTAWLPGGFIGVDIFFVISGFVITWQIIRLYDENKFSLLDFYQRRCKRILPAIYFLLICTAAFAVVALYPHDYRQFFSAAKKIIFLMPNYYFARGTNYFEPSHDSSPLLHTWSLGVEEQLYIIYPIILLWSLKKLSRLRSFILVGVILLLSFIYSLYLLKHYPTQAFYMPHSRAWEFLIGGLLAFHLLPTLKPVYSRLLAFAGVLLLSSGLLFLNNDSLFPGWNALLPCLGTALLIYVGSYSATPLRVLTSKILVFTGKISYSLYLWHWPLIAFYGLVTQKSPAWPVAIAIFISAYLIAYLSWRYIEQPIRKSHFPILNNLNISNKFNNRIIKTLILGNLQNYAVLFTATSSAIVLIIGLQILSKQPKADWRIYKAELKDKKNSKDPLEVFITNPEKYQGILYGDSHALKYYPAINQWAETHHLQIKLYSSPNCPGFFGEFPTKGKPTEVAECYAHKTKAEQMIESDPNIKLVFLAFRYEHYTETPAQKAAFKSQLSYTVKKLKKMNKQIVILAQVPIFKNVPHYTTLWDMYWDRDRKEFGFATIDPVFNNAKLAYANSVLKDVARENDVELFDPALYIKTSHDNGISLYYDDNHLSHYGSVYLGQYLTFPGLEKSV